jgi:aryl-alcohol dehydrogenase-like predicted oxidoreductase
LGEFIKASGTQDKAKVATKFATLPWRFTSNSVVEACKVCNVAKDLQSSHICLLVKYHALRVHVPPVLQPHNFGPHTWVQVNRASLLECETSTHVLIEVAHGFCLKG